MTSKAVVPRDQAHSDVEQAIDHYAREAGTDSALGFIEALEAAYKWIAEHPGTGSPRYAHELNLPIRYVGIGEKIDDLLPFDAEKFIESLFEK